MPIKAKAVWRPVAAVTLLVGANFAVATAALAQEVPEVAKKACIARVQEQVGDVEVTIIQSDYSEGGSMLILQDSNMNENWQCMVSNNGEVQSLTPQGGG